MPHLPELPMPGSLQQYIGQVTGSEKRVPCLWPPQAAPYARSLGDPRTTVLERILLFLFAVVAAGFMVAALVAFPTDARTGVLYLMGALFLAGLTWRSWKRLAALIRSGQGRQNRHQMPL